MLPNPDKVRYITANDLKKSDVLLIDVRLKEAFQEKRIPQSANVCVYEISFAEQVERLVGDKAAPIVVYGEGAPFKADLAAVGRLHSTGFTHVSVLEGGLGQWVEEGRPTVGEGAVHGDSPAGQLALDAEKTKVRWIGRNLTNQHDGLVEAKSGFLKIADDGELIEGEVVVDLTTLSCRDIEDSSLAGVLIGHLQNADFFEVSKYPEASFHLSSARRMPGVPCGSPNYRIIGNLCARGQEMEIELDAMVEPISEGYVFQAVFDFDRTKVGAVYGSGRFFERLGMHLVNDFVTIDVMAIFKPSVGE